MSRKLLVWTVFALVVFGPVSILAAQTTQSGTELRESPCHGNCVQGATSGPGCWQDIVHDEHEREDACTNFGYNRSTPFPYQRVMGNGSCDRFWPNAQTHMRCFSTSDLSASQCSINGILACPRPGGGVNQHYYDISCFGPADNSARIPMASSREDSVGCAGDDVVTCQCTDSGGMLCNYIN